MRRRLKKINDDDANEAPGVEVEPGSDMKVTYEVTNTGNRPVFNVNVTDKITTEGDKAVEGITASDEGKAAKLNPGEKVEFTATIKAPSTGGTLHTDLATAHGVSPKPGKPDEPGDPKSPPVTSNEDPANATTSAHDALTIVKKINGDDANEAPGVTVEPGADMKVTYEVTNTGNRPVYNVTVADKITTEGDKAVEGIKPSDEAKAAKLDPGQTVTFSATVKAPAASGTLHTDLATAHGVSPKPGKPDEPGDPKDPQSPPVTSNEDPGNATTSFKDGLAIVKKINDDDANEAPGVEVEPGSDMKVTYEVTNTGNRPVFNVNVTDKITSEGDKAVEGITASDEGKAAKLNPGEKVEFTATIKAPSTGGTLHTDLATAHGVSPKPGKPDEPGDPNDPQSPPVNSNEDPGNATTKTPAETSSSTPPAPPAVTSTTEPPASSTEPAPTTSSTEPRPTTTVPTTSSTEPRPTTTAPSTSSTEPRPTTTAPTTSSTEPRPTTAVPSTSTTEPAPSTSTTEPSPSAPATSSTEPSATTSVPPAPTTPPTPPPVPPAPVMPPAPGTVTPQVPVPPATRTPGAPADKIVSEGDKAVENIATATPEKAKRLNPGESVEFTATIKAPAVGGAQHHDVAQAHGVPPSPTDPNRPAEPPSPGNPPSSSVPPSPSEPGQPGVPPSPDEPNRPGVPPVTSPEDPGFARTTPQDGLKVVKKINGDDANTAPGVEVKPGSDMNITYEVTNTGNRPLFNVSVVDLIATDNNAEVKNITTATPEKA
ncbi:hypothetical protein MTQ16_10675, partial [Corynebacterium bovis]|uniref:DUF7507 domain-containing protein n=1 Tax=Corynebacterium bovis TaxID=36808 RepID=UPI00313A6DB5